MNIHSVRSPKTMLARSRDFTSDKKESQFKSGIKIGEFTLGG
jgi:hypothetical protein